MAINCAKLQELFGYLILFDGITLKLLCTKYLLTYQEILDNDWHTDTEDDVDDITYPWIW